MGEAKSPNQYLMGLIIQAASWKFPTHTTRRDEQYNINHCWNKGINSPGFITILGLIFGKNALNFCRNNLRIDESCERNNVDLDKCHICIVTKVT